MGWGGRAGPVAVVVVVAALSAGSPPAAGVPTPGLAPPSIAADAPDPEVLVDDGVAWLFTTQVGLASVPVRSSDDGLRTWSAPGDALPVLPDWAAWGHTWSPGVERFGDEYVMFFTARYAAAGVQCIGRAVSSAPGGPYVDSTDQPYICQGGEGGSIDADVYLDPDGNPWLLWKTDGNAIGVPSRIYSSRLTADGAGLIGPVTVLLTSNAADLGIIENPSMVHDGVRTYLVFSARQWWTAGYRMERSICAGPAGPCVREAGEWLGPTSTLVGPGGGSVFRDTDGALRLATHAWWGGTGYDAGGVRAMWIGPADLDHAPLWYAAPPPGTISWYLRNDASNATPDRGFSYGRAGNVGIACDWNGDGTDTNGVYEAGHWYLRNDPTGGAPHIGVDYGTARYTPVCGDWDGDGDDSVGVFLDGRWHLRNANTPGVPHVNVDYGIAAYTPVVGDWDGDGDDTIGVFVDGHWYLRNSNTPGTPDLVIDYGVRGYTPVVGDWDGDGDDSIGVFVDGWWFLRDSNTPGVPDRTFRYGQRGYAPLAGDWEDTGSDGVAVLVNS